MKKLKDFIVKIVKAISKHWVISLVTIVSVAAATFAGVFVGSTVFRKTYDPNDVMVIEDDDASLFKKYQECNGDYSSLKPYEIANIGLYKASLHDSLRIVSKGDVIASGVSQTVRGYAIKNGNSYFMENISKGLISCSWRVYQEEDVKTYPGKDIDVEKATYQEDDFNAYSLDEYISLWGKPLSRPNIYVISSDSVLSGETSINEDRYIVELELDPNKSVVKYVKQMKVVSGLSDYPVFYNVHLTFTLDSELNLLKINTVEKYEVNKLGVHSSTGTLEDSYFYDEGIAIPQLNNPLTY